MSDIGGGKGGPGPAMHNDEPICRKTSREEQGRIFQVTVHATKGTGDDPVDFSFESPLKNQENGHLVFYKNRDKMRRQDFYLLEFMLDDQSGLGLRFEPNPCHAFWVAMGDNVSPPDCPQEPSYDETIFVVQSHLHGKTLLVRNDDDVPQFFRFSLGFVDQDGKPHRFDPIGQNQNGGIGQFE
ncbi:MAG: hypothetical protein ACM3ZV_00785 [Bacillota bacterium]